MAAAKWEQGWLSTARQLPSDNQDERPDGSGVELLVIHNISLPPGEFGGGFIEALFTNRIDCSQHPYFARLEGLHVSAHFLIDRKGGLLQFVPVDRRAWHAGESNFCGRSRCNDFSIGVELEGCDDQPFEPEQYATLAALYRVLCQRFPALLCRDNVCGHSDIAPGRKTDPGPCFEWSLFWQKAGAEN